MAEPAWHPGMTLTESIKRKKEPIDGAGAQLYNTFDVDEALSYGFETRGIPRIGCEGEADEANRRGLDFRPPAGWPRHPTRRIR